LRIGDAVLKFVTNHLEVQHAKRALGWRRLDALTGVANKQHFAVICEKSLQLGTEVRPRAQLVCSTSITSS